MEKRVMMAMPKKQKQKPQKGKFLRINNVIGTPFIFPRRESQGRDSTKWR